MGADALRAAAHHAAGARCGGGRAGHSGDDHARADRGDPVFGLAVGVMITYALAESGYDNALYVDRDVLEPVAAGSVQP